MGTVNGFDNAVDDGVEGGLLEAQHGDVVERVVRVAAWPRMRVGGADQHVLLVVQRAVACGQAGQHCLMNGLGDQAGVGDHHHG